ncbi:MAG: hypothetical protein AAFR96_00395 [Planctomycetota bacterium]
MTESQADRQDLTAGQAARLLRDGRLGEILLRRAATQARRHRGVIDAGESDQAEALRRAVRAHKACPHKAGDPGAGAAA